MNSSHRKKLLIDQNIQTGILFRFLTYAFLSFIFVTLLLSFLRMWADPSRLWIAHVANVWFDYSPVLICLAALTPLAIYDLLNFTNRFAGPVFRLRQELGRLKNGAEVETVKFRKNDFWPDLSENFNELTNQVLELKAENQKLAAKLAGK